MLHVHKKIENVIQKIKIVCYFAVDEKAAESSFIHRE
jgi:hypothetical protein